MVETPFIGIPWRNVGVESVKYRHDTDIPKVQENPAGIYVREPLPEEKR